MISKRQKKLQNNQTRFYIIIMVFISLSAVIFFRLFWLQIKQYDYYSELASKQYKVKKKLLPKRGEIFLQGKTGLFPVAINKKMPTVYVVPNEVVEKEKAIKILTDTLNLTEEEVAKKVNKNGDPYEVIKRKLSKEEYQKIKEENLAGIHFNEETWRYYPAETLAAHIIGFLGYKQNGEVVGRYGVEQFFNKVLSGKRGYVEEDGDVRGHWISIGRRNINKSYDGDNLILTIKQVIQFQVELALQNAVKKHQADGGEIIVLDPQTGKILAMASSPTFNPNKYGQFSMAEFRNPIVSDNYEPGSVFKTITMSAGLDTGKVSPTTTYYDTGAVNSSGYTIKNSDKKSYGQQTMTEVIEKSLNTGVIFVEKQIGHRVFRQYVKKFGFGSKTNITLPGEAGGNIQNLKSRSEVDFFTASFGQGISVTPLQLAMAYGVIANGGTLLKPIIVDKIVDYNNGNKIKKSFQTKKIRTVISEKAARQMALMLESNVKNGHGKLAGVPGYRVAGKTGTAQIPDRKNGGYVEGATIGTFAGFAPVDKPVFVMVVIIKHPRDTEWAAGTAAPVFGELTRFLLNYFGVEPTESYQEKDLETFAKKHHYLEVSLEEDEDEDNQEETKQ